MNLSGNTNFNSHTTKDKTKTETVKVCIRSRPLLQHEDAEFWLIDKNSIATINSQTANSRLNNDNSRHESTSVLSNTRNDKERDLKKVLMDSIYSPQNFAFDKIYNTSANSQLIYKEACRSITKSVISGYNGTIFMYGQTTSGKTFTMLGTPNSPGILPCALRDIFNLISKEKNAETFSVLCSYVEIYNENIHDLLTDANNLKLVDDNKYGVIVSGAKRIKIKNFEDGITLKDFGEENRKYRETLINEYSSRSHTIFQVFVESEHFTNEAEGIRYSCLNLVDLAGSERLNDYDTKTEAFGETGYINKSLFVLANVVNKLAEGKNQYIPYRDSKLTRLLSQALGGNSLTAVICTISPAAVNYYQTLSTLRFATRAKIVKTKATINEYMDDKGAIEFYKNEIKKLQDELTKKNTSFNTSNPNFNTGEKVFVGGTKNSNNVVNANNIPYHENKELLEHIMKTNESLTNELENYKEKYLTEKEKNDVIKNEIEKLKVSPVNPVNGVDNAKNKYPTSGNNFNYDYSKGTKSSNNVLQINYSNNDADEINGVANQPIKSYSDKINNSPINEVQYSENIISKLSHHVEKHKNFDYWKEDVERLNSEYK